MDDKTLIDTFTEKSIAGLNQEHFKELWVPGDHMHRGEFVSPSRPDLYFASDAEVDAYRDALARMDGTVDAPLPTMQATAPTSAPVQEQERAGRDPLVEALSAASQPKSSGHPGFADESEGDGHKRAYRHDHHDDDDDDDDEREDDD